MGYAEFEVPDGLAETTYTAVEKARDTGELRKGTNEATKAIERGNADLVVIASDVEPEEIIMHLPALCQEKDISYTFVPSKEELGLASGINVQTAAIAICDAGNSDDELDEIQDKVEELSE